MAIAEDNLLTIQDLQGFFLAYSIMGLGWFTCGIIRRIKRLSPNHHMHYEWKKPHHYIFMISHDFPFDIFLVILVFWFPFQMVIWCQALWQSVIRKLGYNV